MDVFMQQKKDEVLGSLIEPLKDHTRTRYTPERNSNKTLHKAHKSIKNPNDFAGLGHATHDFLLFNNI